MNRKLYMNKFTNIITGHSLKEYNKKYRNKRYELIVCTKEQVEEFDREHGLFEEKKINGKKEINYQYFLLKDKKWWEIENKFYEIPKPPRFIWFRNLNAATQIAICGLGICLVGGGVATPLIINYINNSKFDVNATIDDSKKDKISITKKEVVEATGDINYYLKVVEGKCIESIAIRSGVFELIEDVDFVFDQFENKITFKKASAHRIDKNVTIYPSLMETAKKTVTKEQWLATYKRYSNKFNTLTKMYNSNKIIIKFNGSDLKFYKIPFLFDDENDNRQCYLRFIYNNAVGQQIVAGGNYSYKLIDSKVFQIQELTYDIEYSLENNHAAFTYKDKTSGEAIGTLSFNCNGYLEKFEKYGSNPQSLIIEYNGSPTEDINYCFVSKGSGYNKEAVATGNYCAYQSFNVVDSSDYKINFKSGKKYKFYTTISKHSIDPTSTGTKTACKFRISDVCFTSGYHIKNYISNIKAYVNDNNMNINFSDTSINSLKLEQEVNQLNDLFVFEFECTQDFSSYIKFTGTMEV